MKKKILVTLGIALSLGIALYLAYASTTNWPFTTSGDYTYDANKIDVTGGVAKLKELAKTQDTQAELEGTSPNTAGGFGYHANKCENSC